MDKSFVQKRMMEYAKASDKSLAEISQKMGHSSNYISNACSGRFDPKIEEILYFCELLHIKPSDFFSEEDFSPEHQEAISLLRQLDVPAVKAVIEMMKQLIRYKNRRF